MNTDDLVSQLIPVYAKYYTMEDLKAINTFLESPSGRHMISLQPQISTEAMQIGQVWGKSVAQRVMMEMQDEQKNSPASSSPTTPPPTPPPTAAPKSGG